MSIKETLKLEINNLEEKDKNYLIKTLTELYEKKQKEISLKPSILLAGFLFKLLKYRM
jgi:hypothetical protein